MLTTTIAILALFIVSFSDVALAGLSCFQLFENSQIESVEKNFTLIKVYSEGQKSANQILFLSESEFRQIIDKQVLLDQTIVVLDSLPFDVDLPLVAAIFVRRPFSSQDTHNQVLAQKAQIPVVHLQNPSAVADLLQLKKSGSFFKVECSNSACKILTSNRAFPRPSIRPSVFPKEGHRNVGLWFKTTFKASPHDFIDPDDLRAGFETTPREIYGDKFHSLHRFSSFHPDLVPPAISVSSGIFEKFTRSFQFKSKSLHQLIQETNSRIETQSAAGNEAGVRQSLTELRNAIWKAKPIDESKSQFFEEVSSAIIALFKGKLMGDEDFMVRSNNDAEDLFAAGLYRSGLSKSLAPDELAEQFKKTWMSMFEYRAFTLRRANGQLERNLSMPLLIHPFVRQRAHSLLKIRVNSDGKFILIAQVAYGEKVNATNPTQATTSYHFEIDFNQGHPQIRPLDLASAEGPQADAFLKSLNTFIEKIMPFANEELKRRVFAKKSIDFEIAWGHRGQFPQSASEILVLQYKQVYDRQTTEALLAGEISHKQLDAVHFPGQGVTNLLSAGLLHFLSNISPAQAISQARKSYALLQINGQNQLVVWSTGSHESMKAMLHGTGAIWLKSGVIYYSKDSRGAHLHFSATSFPKNDPYQSVDSLKALFSDALSDLEKKSIAWQSFLQSPNLKISVNPFHPNQNPLLENNQNLYLK